MFLKSEFYIFKIFKFKILDFCAFTFSDKCMIITHLHKYRHYHQAIWTLSSFCVVCVQFMVVMYKLHLYNWKKQNGQLWFWLCSVKEMPPYFSTCSLWRTKEHQHQYMAKGNSLQVLSLLFFSPTKKNKNKTIASMSTVQCQLCRCLVQLSLGLYESIIRNNYWLIILWMVITENPVQI